MNSKTMGVFTMNQSKAEELKRMFPGLKVVLVGTWIWISGETREHAEALKAQGARFSRKSSRWYVKGIRKGNPRRPMGYIYAATRYGEDEITAA